MVIRYSVLLVSVVALLLIDPLIQDQFLGVSSSRWLFSGVLLTAVWATGRSRRRFFIGLALVVPTILMEWVLGLEPDSTVLQILNLAFSGLFISFVCASIMHALFLEDRVTRDTIAGGILVYLLLGILWWVAYLYADEPTNALGILSIRKCRHRIVNNTPIFSA